MGLFDRKPKGTPRRIQPAGAAVRVSYSGEFPLDYLLPKYIQVQSVSIEEYRKAVQQASGQH
jgi:hypothetical protein